MKNRTLLPWISLNMGTVEESVNKCQKNYECYLISKSNLSILL